MLFFLYSIPLCSYLIVADTFQTLLPRFFLLSILSFRHFAAVTIHIYLLLTSPSTSQKETNLWTHLKNKLNLLSAMLLRQSFPTLSRHTALFHIVWQMITCFVPYSNRVTRAERTHLCRSFDQLSHGQDYSDVKPVIHIAFLDYSLFPENPEFCATYRLMNEKII